MSVYTSNRKPVSRRFTPFSPEQFASEVETLRLHFLRFICKVRPCNEEDAQDILQEALFEALRHLSTYDPITGRPGLVAWTKGFIQKIILRDRRATAQQPDTVPLLDAIEIPAHPSDGLASEIRASLQLLRPEVYAVVCDHLDGYRNTEIAHRNRVHINTVTNRMQEAAETLRCEFTSFVAVWDMRFYLECTHHAKYTKQNDMAKYWKNNHPPERRRSYPLRGSEEWAEEAGVRPSLLRDLYCPDPLLRGAKSLTDKQRDAAGSGVGGR